MGFGGSDGFEAEEMFWERFVIDCSATYIIVSHE